MEIGGRAAPQGGMGRHYMNKMFGAGLERARQEDEEQGKRAGSVSRITIEPREDGRGHRVTVEKHTVMMHGGGGNDRAEHEFDKPEDALQFLHELMHGGEPEEEAEGASRRAGPGDRGKGGGELEAALAAGSKGGEDEDSW